MSRTSWIVKATDRDGELRLHAGDELHEERLERERPCRSGEHETARVRACGGKCSCRPVRVPAELVGDREDPLAGDVRHSRASVERVRDRALRDAGPLGDVPDRRSASSLLGHFAVGPPCAGRYTPYDLFTGSVTQPTPHTLAARLPTRLHLGSGDCRVPDRGRRLRGRPRREHLGPLHVHTRATSRTVIRGKSPATRTTGTPRTCG